MTKLYWMSDGEWARLEPLLLSGRRDAHRVDDRRVVSGIIRVLRSAARWRDFLSGHGPCTTVFNRWSHQGLWHAIGCSRGEQTSKLQGATDGLGRPRTLLISPGNTNDIQYDANHLRALLAAKNVEAVIAFTPSRTAPIRSDAATCRIRNLIERMWARLKDWRRVATRYDKLTRNSSAPR
jgi:transposase